MSPRGTASSTRTARASAHSSPAGGCARSRLRIDELVDVLAEEVGFQVHRVADRAFAQGGRLERVGDDPDAEFLFAHGRNGEAYPVHGDGTFENDVAHHVGWRGDFEDVVASGAFPARDRAGAVDVAGDKMAAQARANLEGTLQVHERTGARVVEIGAPPGFLEQIDPDQFRGAARGEVDDRQAAAVAGEAVADFQAVPANF